MDGQSLYKPPTPITKVKSTKYPTLLLYGKEVSTTDGASTTRVVLEDLPGMGKLQTTRRRHSMHSRKYFASRSFSKEHGNRTLTCVGCDARLGDTQLARGSHLATVRDLRLPKPHACIPVVEESQLPSRTWLLPSAVPNEIAYYGRQTAL